VVILRGYSGTITATSEQMTIRMIGGKIDFTAEGEGTAYLRGRGSYETQHGSDEWSASGTTLSIVAE
jgi:hypothetical protein